MVMFILHLHLLTCLGHCTHRRIAVFSKTRTLVVQPIGSHFVTCAVMIYLFIYLFFFLFFIFLKFMVFRYCIFQCIRHT